MAVLGLLLGAVVLGSIVLLESPAPRVSSEPPVGYDIGAAPAPDEADPIVDMPTGDQAAEPVPSAAPPAGDTPAEGLAPGPRPEVPVTSGRLAEVAAVTAAEPLRLRIPDLGVDAPIAPVGYLDGEMEVPTSADLVGWYRYGPEPGGAGSAVLAAHVDWGGRAGVFIDLRNLPAGAEIEVEFDDGSSQWFRSVRLSSYDKDELPVEQIFSRSGSPVVTLITCGGAFNPSLRSYEDNVVVYAVPTGSGDAGLR